MSDSVQAPLAGGTQPDPSAGPSHQNGWIRRGVWLLGLFVVLALVAWGMERGRRAALRIYGGQGAQADWDKWRQDAQQQADGEGPVARRAPYGEPPALVLMRDYYWQCLVGAWLVTAAVAGTLAFLIQGIFRSSGWQPLEDPVHPALRKPGARPAGRGPG